MRTYDPISPFRQLILSSSAQKSHATQFSNSCDFRKWQFMGENGKKAEEFRKRHRFGDAQ